MKKRLLSLLLIICMLFSITTHDLKYVQAEESSPHSVSIEYKGEEISDIVVPEDGKKTIMASCDLSGEYQWQILADAETDLWVDITGKNENNIGLSYAMLSSILDLSGGTYIRCAVTAGEDTIYSKPIGVTVSRTPKFSAVEVPEKQPEQKSVRAMAAAKAPSARAGENEYVYITINYLDGEDEEKKSLYEPYSSQLETGTAFDQTILSPTFLGFAPYYNPEDPDTDDPASATVNASQIALKIDTVTENQVINVYYKAIQVRYAVSYFFQNINDDFYSERTDLYYTGKALTGTIISDDELKEPVKNELGFTALYHYPESVAADGSTIFQCYYDRNYYLLKFDMDGGYGTEPIYARYATPFVVNQPVRYGYEFAGWDEVHPTQDENGNRIYVGDGTADTIPSTIPAENKNYRALWKHINTDVTIAYWKENPDWVADPEHPNDMTGRYHYWGSQTVQEESGSTINGADYRELPQELKDEADASRFEYDRADENVFVYGDNSTVVNVYYTPKEYTLRFFYARSDSWDRYYVVGGSTYYFGMLNTGDNWTLSQLLGNVPNNQWGQVQSEPLLKEECKSRYALGTENYGNYTYYYLAFNAKYGQSLDNLWPIDIFESVMISGSHAQCSNLDYAYFSAWNGERKVKYTQDHPNAQTIKGFYQRLDENLLYASRFGDSDTVNYLGFWDNGADIGWSIPRLWVYELYVPDGDGYKLLKTFNTYDDNKSDNPGSQTQTSLLGYEADERKVTEVSTISIPSVSNPGQTYSMDRYVIKFYYKKKSYDLTIYNADNTELRHESVPFETPLDDKVNLFDKETMERDHYPATYEKNAYTFSGWYTSPIFTDASYYEPGMTMPANNLSLYAKWTPVMHQVRFFHTYENMLEYERTGDSTLMIGREAQPVSHGNVIGDIAEPEPPQEGGLEYIFGGWFYMLNGEKTAFTPLDLPVIRDMNVFADWGSHTPQPYVIHYVLRGEPQTKVADDTTGYGYQGTTRTFFAKAGDPYNQLYPNNPNYNTGYFPTVASHSITLQYEQDKENPVKNSFTFEYVQADNIPYTVKYVDKLTGEPLGKGSKVVDINKKAIVTERFDAIAGYVPDEFYKRLVISVKVNEDGTVSKNPEDNVITFYYTKSKDIAFYAVHHMLQKPGTTLSEQSYQIDGSGDFVEDSVHTEGTGNINTEIVITPQMFTGYNVIEDPAVLVDLGVKNTQISMTDGNFKFKINANGTELYVFYELNEYPYIVKYLDHDGDQILHSEKTGTAQYGTKVKENALAIPGYTLISTQSKEITIKSYDAATGKDNPNEIIFYYISTKYTVQYKVAGNQGGTLSDTLETVVVKEGQYIFKGSVPTAKPGFEFDGWYTDEECTKPVESAWVDENGKLTPRVEGNTLEPEPKTNTFYAKFTELTGDFTIIRRNAEDEGNGAQVFVYKVINKADPSVTIYVSIAGNGSVKIKNLRFGDYTVEQINDWSWRYEDAAQTTVSHMESGTEVTFDDSASVQQWLNGNSGVKVNDKGGQP